MIRIETGWMRCTWVHSEVDTVELLSSEESVQEGRLTFKVSIRQNGEDGARFFNHSVDPDGAVDGGLETALRKGASLNQI